MENEDGILNSLEYKVKQLANLYVKVKEERDQLSSQSIEQKKTIEDQNTEIEKLKLQVQALKSGIPGGKTVETEKTKEKIAGLAREIDRCIELLNK